MEIIYFAYFMSIASGKTFLDTAEDFHISQSSLSKSIRKIEEYYDVILFDRSHRSASLTPAGRELYRHLKLLQPCYKDLQESLRPYALSRAINYCFLPTPDPRISKFIGKFSDQHPDIVLTGTDSRSWTNSFEEMEKGSLDFIITHKPFILNQQYNCATILNDSLKLVLPMSHPLAKRKTVPLAMLGGETIYVNNFSQYAFQDLWPLLSKPPVLRKTLLSWVDLLPDIAADNGITLVFENGIRNADLSNVAIRSIEEYPVIPVVLLYIKGRKPTHSMKEFISFMTETQIQS